MRIQPSQAQLYGKNVTIRSTYEERRRSTRVAPHKHPRGPHIGSEAAVLGARTQPPPSLSPSPGVRNPATLPPDPFPRRTALDERQGAPANDSGAPSRGSEAGYAAVSAPRGAGNDGQTSRATGSPGPAQRALANAGGWAVRVETESEGGDDIEQEDAVVIHTTGTVHGRDGNDYEFEAVLEVVESNATAAAAFTMVQAAAGPTPLSDATPKANDTAPIAGARASEQGRERQGMFSASEKTLVEREVASDIIAEAPRGEAAGLPVGGPRLVRRSSYPSALTHPTSPDAEQRDRETVSMSGSYVTETGEIRTIARRIDTKA